MRWLKYYFWPKTLKNLANSKVKLRKFESREKLIRAFSQSDWFSYRSESELDFRLNFFQKWPDFNQNLRKFQPTENFILFCLDPPLIEPSQWNYRVILSLISDFQSDDSQSFTGSKMMGSNLSNCNLFYL